MRSDSWLEVTRKLSKSGPHVGSLIRIVVRSSRVQIVHSESRISKRTSDESGIFSRTVASLGRGQRGARRRRRSRRCLVIHGGNLPRRVWDGNRNSNDREDQTVGFSREEKGLLRDEGRGRGGPADDQSPALFHVNSEHTVGLYHSLITTLRSR